LSTQCCFLYPRKEILVSTKLSLSLSLFLSHTHTYTPLLFSFYSLLFLAGEEIFIDGNYMVVRVMNGDRKSLKYGI
jgi:hypothetical protein